MKTLLLAAVIYLSQFSLRTEPVSWEKHDVAQLTMRLRDSKIEEWYSFHRSGDVSVTYGTKKSVTSPIFKWKIKKGQLFIIDDTNNIFQELTLVSRTNKELVVYNKSGATVIFDILKAEQGAAANP